MLHSTNPAFEKKNCRRPSNQPILEMKEHVQSCEFQKGVLHKLWTYRLSSKATASIIPPAVLLFHLYGEASLACVNCFSVKAVDHVAHLSASCLRRSAHGVNGHCASI